MDVLTALRTILGENPGMRAKYLVEELEEKTRTGRSSLYVQLAKLRNQDEPEILVVKCRYYLSRFNQDIAKMQQMSALQARLGKIVGELKRNYPYMREISIKDLEKMAHLHRDNIGSRKTMFQKAARTVAKMHGIRIGPRTYPELGYHSLADVYGTSSTLPDFELP
jgi:hypothetical protein